ncbi:hypothetical protein BC832DRAFT_548525 [Gaertneriomyces semiglobifer]|nr:hypothetical protein BC832DRAFT_548525 [Gaertneriomyces semiglobifer]
MDSNYLKQTVGPVLASGLASLITHGYDTASSGPRGLDAITYLGEYLLHHDRSMQQIAKDSEYRSTLQALRDAALAAEKADAETRRRFEKELSTRTEAIKEEAKKSLEIDAKVQNDMAVAEAEQTAAVPLDNPGSEAQPEATEENEGDAQATSRKKGEESGGGIAPPSEIAATAIAEEGEDEEGEDEEE